MNTLTKANEIITGPRRESYGPAIESFQRTATVWSGLLSAKLKEPLTSVEVAILMSAFKLCREMNSHHEDNFIDANGYNELGNQCAQVGAGKEEKVETERFDVMNPTKAFHTLLQFLEQLGAKEQRIEHDSTFLDQESKDHKPIFERLDPCNQSLDGFHSWKLLLSGGGLIYCSLCQQKRNRKLIGFATEAQQKCPHEWVNTAEPTVILCSRCGVEKNIPGRT